MNYRAGKFYCTNVCGVLISTNGYANLCVAEIIQKVTKFYVSYVGNPKLMNNVMREIEISVPALPEQNKISDCFASIDRLIAAEEKKLEALQDYKRGLMQQLFPARDESLPRLRFPGFFDRWKEKRLGDIANVDMGQSPPSSSYNAEQIGKPFVQGMADVVNGKVLPKRYTSRPTKLSNVGDILLSVRAPVGEVLVSNQEVCIGRGFAGIRAKKDIDQDFLLQLLMHIEGILRSLSQGKYLYGNRCR